MRTYAPAIAASVLLLITSCSNPQPQPAPERKEVPAAQVHGTLLEVMRGILFPASNLIFAVQDKNPADIKSTVADVSSATDPFQGPYNGWLAVENGGIAIAESANLLIIPGRKCSNGKDVPINNADWPMLVQGLREAGMKMAQVGQAKNQEGIADAADAVAGACANCHDKYRDKPGGDANRCM
jgi:hypothetical protein